jgi:hypothetical protein
VHPVYRHLYERFIAPADGRAVEPNIDIVRFSYIVYYSQWMYVGASIAVV